MRSRGEPRIRTSRKALTAAVDFRRIYAQLKNPPSNPSIQWLQRRGRKFESILTALLQEEHLVPRLQYRSSGEEVDGSFVLGERTFLLEAKWRRDRIQASALYAFKGKVDGKLVGTIGVFVSMSGYSDDAMDALMRGKDLNVVLFDGKDVDVCMEGRVGFKKVLAYKLRLAAEEGLVYAPSEELSVSATGIQETTILSDRRKS